MQNQKNVQWLFALSRELEFHKDYTNAALIMTNASNDANRSESIRETDEKNPRPGTVFWKSINCRPDIFDDYYSTAENYIEAIYTPEALKALMVNIKQNQNKKDTFSHWLYSGFANSEYGLNELLGTKYLRENKLNEALNAFQHNPTAYWQQDNLVWEKTDNATDWKNGGEGHFSPMFNTDMAVFDHNPFYNLKYTPEFIETKEHLRMNKLVILEKLIEYLNRANSPEEPRRDYYYFLVANAYFNMTRVGNSWMMRRNYLSSYMNVSARVDNDEFNCALLAKEYYAKAAQFSKDEKMSILSIRMAATCESVWEDYMIDTSGHRYDDKKHLPKMVNIYDETLKSKYPEAYAQLHSNCDAFAAYFKN